jgi:hypothetical protein
MTWSASCTTASRAQRPMRCNVADAEKSGDAELAQFFREVQKEEQQPSNRAKELLSNRLSS